MLNIQSMPRSKQLMIFLFIFLSLYFLQMLVFTHPWYNPCNDSSIYISCTKSLLAGKGYSYLDIPFQIRPPGFSFMIAPLISFFGLQFKILNLFIGLFGVLCVIFLFHLNRIKIGWITASLVSLLVWLNPDFQILCNQVLSDIPGLASLLLCFLVERYSSKAPSAKREILLGLCIGLSSYIRTAALLLIPAIVLSRVLHNYSNKNKHEAAWFHFAISRLVLFTTISLLILLPWIIRNNIIHPQNPADQTKLYSVSTAMWHTDPRNPDSAHCDFQTIINRIPIQYNNIAYSIGKWLQVSPNKEPDIKSHISTVVLLLCSIIILVKRRGPTELFVVCNLLVLLIYFGYSTRLILPIYVLSISSAVEVFQICTKRLIGSRATSTVVSIVLIAVICIQFKPQYEWDKIENIHQMFTRFSSNINKRLEDDARVGTDTGHHYSVYLDRPVYSLKYAVPKNNKIHPVEAIIDQYAINTIIFPPFDNAVKSMLPYFTKRYGKQGQTEKVLILRVRP